MHHFFSTWRFLSKNNPQQLILSFLLTVNEANKDGRKKTESKQSKGLAKIQEEEVNVLTVQ